MMRYFLPHEAASCGRGRGRGCLLLDVAIPAHVFGHHGQERYRFTLAGCRPGPVATSTGVLLRAEAGLEVLAAADTIVIAGYEDVLTPPPEPLLAALRAAAARGTRLVSICTGAFALAWAGLLDGRRATTHWRCTGQLAARFPAVSVDPGVLYIDDGDILTSAGVAAGLDLCLHVVRQDHGAAAAASIARWTVVAPHRDGGQAQFIERPIARPDDSAPPSATRTWALEHLGERLDLARLADHACMSPRTFSRRFRAETGTTPLQWLLSQRVTRGLQLLEHTALPVTAVAHACGFTDTATFRRHLGRATGITPAAYRRAFQSRHKLRQVHRDLPL
jgi:AraC family transcriptional regulator, transcriptional activator FtrA